MTHTEAHPPRRVLKRVTRSFFNITTLARWQIRQVWHLFVLVALGMIASVLLVGIVPLLTRVNFTAHARSVFSQNGLDATSHVAISLGQLYVTTLPQTIQQVQDDYQQDGAPFFDLPPQTVFRLSNINIYPSNKATSPLPDQLLSLHGYNLGPIASHLKLLQGHLPRSASNELEIALTQDNATQLNAHLGSTYTIHAIMTLIIKSKQPLAPPTIIRSKVPIKLKVVGILQNVKPVDEYGLVWHGDTLDLQKPSNGPLQDNMLASMPALFSLLSQVDKQHEGQLSLECPGSCDKAIDISFPLDIPAITDTNVSQLPTDLTNLANAESIDLGSGAFSSNAPISSITIDNTSLMFAYQQIGAQTSIAQIPSLTILALMFGLLLLFIAFMVELLVTRQAEAIALMRSRGATLAQVFLAFVSQSLLLGLLTIVASALCVPLIIRALVFAFLPAFSQQALNILPTTPWDTLNALGWYPWIAAALATLTMIAIAWRALRSSMLEHSDRQTAGAQRPLWQRIYADAILALLGLLTAGLYNYLAVLNVLDAQTQFLLAGPCLLAAATLLCLAGGLAFLRLFPLLVRLGSRVTRTKRGLIPYFPLLNMARAPRYAIRSALLLTFTLIFALFAQIFFATQQQHTLDLANYLAPADISGALIQTQVQRSFAPQEAQYQHIPGVKNAALAFSDEWTIADQNSTSATSASLLTLIATDPTSFGHAINWPAVDNTNHAQTMLAQLAKQRASIVQTSASLNPNTNPTLPVLPAMVSATTAKLLHLNVGKTFSLRATDFGVVLTFIDVGQVPYLPGIANIGSDQGVLVDYSSFAAEITVVDFSTAPDPTTIWLRIKPGEASRVFSKLASGPLALGGTIISHQTMLSDLRDDPLTLNLLCLLVLGIGLALLLAWIGCLVSAWLSVRARLRGLLALRALGATPRQLGWLLTWEQTLIFAAALLLGIIGATGFTALALPDVVLSSVTQIVVSVDVFQTQLIPLVLVLPATLWLGLGVLILLCATTVGLTGSWIARLSPAQMLRLSEDYVEEASLAAPQMKKDEQEAPQKTQSARLGGLRLWGEANLGRALTPVRQSWGILSLAQLGILCAILFFAVVPLFSQVSATAGLQTLLTQPANRYVSVSVTNATTDAIPFGHVQAALKWATATLDRTVSTQAAGYVQPTPVIALNLGQITFPGTSPDAPTYQSSLPLTLNFAGLSAHDLPGQIKLVQGQLPQPGKILQILLTPQAATSLHLKVGELLTQAEGYPIAMRVVGLFQPRNSASPFLPISFFFAGNLRQNINPQVTALTTTEALGPALDAAKPPQASVYGSFSAAITWSYPLTQAVNSTQLDSLVAALSSLRVPTSNAQTAHFTLTAFNTPVAAFQQYQQRIAVSHIPILCLSTLIIALLLLFLSFMVDLLVEREANTIATLRSRGATHGQIYRAFLKRTLTMSGLGLLGGLILAIPVMLVLTHLTLMPSDQQAGLQQLIAQPGQSLLTVLLWALAGALVTCVGTSLTLLPATRSDVLAQRREAARATRKPYWQRWYLDVVVMVLALTAYVYMLYMSNSNLLSPDLLVQVKAPLALAATLCFVLGCMLFFLRLFPLLLRLGARQAGRAQGVERMLALVQMARAPRQRLRTALLLLLTTAFIVFVPIFAASQNQHLSDVAQQWAGSDFSGAAYSLTAKQIKAYNQLSGVTSVTAGYTDTLDIEDGEVNIIAVDPRSFLRTVAWPGMSTVQEQTLLAELTNPGAFPDLAQAWQGVTNEVPAVIDEQAAQTLQLTRGQLVSASDGQAYLIVAVVQNIPSINNLVSTATIVNTGEIPGMLVDYKMANLSYLEQQESAGGPIPSQTVQEQNLSLNYLWLKTDGSTQSLQRVRRALTTGPLSLTSFYDHQANLDALSRNPLERDLSGIQALGAFVPLLLTWIACLLASWIDVRQRQLLLGVLRALGTTPRQLTKVLAWEQGLTFGSAILLGTLFGLLTAFLTLPSLVLTSILPQLSSAAGLSIASSGQDLFTLQEALPAHVVLPSTILAIVALLALLSVLAVFLMTRSASRLSLGQMLRLNED